MTSPKRYDDTIAVVSGASSGLGRRICLDLASRGATVIGLARRADLLAQLEPVLRSYGQEGSTRVCDVGDVELFRRTLGEIEDHHGRIDILVNNAATERTTPREEGWSEDYRRMFDVNFFGLVAGTLHVLPGMLARRRGIVVNVSSDAARAPEPGHGAYSASKAAVSAFSESVSHEVARGGVHVHVLYPGWMPTAMGLSGSVDGGDLPPKAVRRSEEHVSALVLERMGGPRVEINAAALPLLAPILRTIAPLIYQRAIRGRGR
jgi:NAD(P)-dependent dehydrogenase (short-subunit alcohol dehydrogenase family)